MMKRAHRDVIERRSRLVPFLMGLGLAGGIGYVALVLLPRLFTLPTIPGVTP